ncbi:MAG: MFS transporter [Gammaproteobacteria bacterium]
MSEIPVERLSATELRAGVSLATIFFLRMSGLFMITPVFVLYAEHLRGATAGLVGLAIGIYGLTQALFQIPFGMISDRIGRKKVIGAGLLVFVLGSVLAALGRDIYWVTLGRALQGAGAVGSATLALAADLTREEHRTKVMAMIGITIGLAFPIAFVAGPAVSAHFGAPSVFWLAAVLGLASIAVLMLWVPTPVRSSFHRDCEIIPAQFLDILLDRNLLRLDFGVLALHAIMTATFVVMPLALRDAAGLELGRHWHVYLPVLALSVVALAPLLRLSSGSGSRAKGVFCASVFALFAAELGLRYGHAHLPALGVSMWIFFTAFNFLEASLPTLISRLAPADRRGTAMGVYSTAQFLGIFIGGAAGGWLHGRYGMQAVFLFAAAIAAIWGVLALGMAKPRHLVSRMHSVGPISRVEAADLAARYGALPGVAEAVIVAEDGIAYLKVDPQIFDPAALRPDAAATG